MATALGDCGDRSKKADFGAWFGSYFFSIDIKAVHASVFSLWHFSARLSEGWYVILVGSKSDLQGASYSAKKE